MKTGTDAILLSALTPVFSPEKILDIGTGCGIVALCMAQRYKQSKITAIDIDRNSIKEAIDNFKNSKFASRLNTFQISLQDFAKKSKTPFDLIVSNPPFFTNSLLSKNEKRNIARHNITLTLEDLAIYPPLLLSSNGYFVIILPAKETDDFISLALNHNLFCYKQYFVFDKICKACKRIVSILTKSEISHQIIKHNIILRETNNNYTEQYRNLASEFLVGL
jgi:tRNA1Val (adenine37-N6)-methyltransferase